VFISFVASCLFSILASAWSLFFPAQGSSFILGRLFPIAYLCVLFMMLRYSFCLRDQLKNNSDC
jgi:hypothetical protein